MQNNDFNNLSRYLTIVAYGEFGDYFSKYQFFKKESAPCSMLW